MKTKTKEVKEVCKDIYIGKLIQAWEDEGFIYLSFPWSVAVFPKEEWKNIKKELTKIK